MRRILFIPLTIFLISSFAGALPVKAAEIFVNSTADIADPTPGGGVCDVGGGVCTLRAAVQTANGIPGADTIRLPANPNPYLLTIPPMNEDQSAEGDLDIRESLSIQGGGMDQTVVDASGIPGQDRVFHIIAASGVPIQVNISGLSITGGDARTSLQSAGGGMLFLGTDPSIDTLNLSQVNVHNNVAHGGGGIIAGGASFYFTKSVVKDNTAIFAGNGMPGDGAIGGLGIQTGPMGPATMILSECEVSGNTAQAKVGGVVMEVGSMKISQSNISGNISGEDVGGVALQFGDLEVAQSTIANNTAALSVGGAIVGVGDFTLSDSIISDNVAGGGMGGAGVGEGSFNITASTIVGNQAAGGGGLVMGKGELTLTDSTVSDNTASDTGGGLMVIEGTTLIDNTLVTRNRSESMMGGIFLGGGDHVLSFSTVSDNHAADSFGGIMVLNGTTAIHNSTVSGNSANGPIGGIGVFENGALVLTNSTLSGNSSAEAGGGVVVDVDASFTANSSTLFNNEAAGQGGGIAYSGNVELRNTILAGNRAAEGPDCFADTSTGAPSPLVSDGYNLIGNASDCSFPPDVTGDQVGDAALPLDPNLAPLADNGGPTLTHALLFGSPAINGGNPSGCTDGTLLLTTDQRGPGFPRVSFNSWGISTCDIGAFEFQGEIFLQGGGLGCRIGRGNGMGGSASILFVYSFLLILRMFFLLQSRHQTIRTRHHK